MISADVEYKIKVSTISEFGIIDFILLGHDKEVLSVVFFSGKFFSCDAAGVLKRWNSETDVLSVKINEPVKFYVFGEYLLGVSDSNTYVIDSFFLQVIPIKDFSIIPHYPHAIQISQDSIQEIQIQFPLDS